ncbi:MAG: hypothetical protein V9G98_21555 [Candidatus Competibacter sp.]
MDQQYTQQRGGILESASAPQRASTPRRLLPPIGQHPLNDFPVFAQSGEHLFPINIVGEFVHVTAQSSVVVNRPEV